MSSIGSNQSSKRWELVSIAECESSGLLVTFFMAWSPGRRFNDGDSRLITPETTPPSIPTNPATGPLQVRLAKEKVEVSQSGISRFLHHINLTFKKKHTRGGARSARRSRGP